MSAADQDHPVSTQPSPNGHEIHRRVSIAENHGLHGHDNPAFDSPRSRKVSAASDHAEMGPVRKKSILHHAHASENISLPGGKSSFNPGAFNYFSTRYQACFID